MTALPPGFVLDGQSAPKAMVPEGFVLDGPKTRTWGQYAADVAENVPRRFLQGATFGFGEELSSGLAALPAYLNDKEFKTEYDKNLAFQRGKIQEAKQENPYLGGAAEIGGAIGPGIAAIPKSVLGWAGSGGRLARSLKGAAVGAPVAGASGAVYGYGTGEGGVDNRMGEAASMGTASAIAGAALPLGIGAVGGLTSAAVKGAGNVRAGIGARGAEELDDAAMAIKDIATQQYAKMRQAGAVFSPNATQNIQAKISQTLAQDGALNPRLHDKVLAVYDDITQGLSKGAVGLDELDQWRQVLGDIAGNFSDKVNARKATLMIKSIDDLVENVQLTDLISGGKEAVEALKAGREAWARQSRFRAVADVVKNAGNDVNKLKRDLSKMLINPKKTRGFSKEEIEALKTAARQTTGEGIMKMMGKFGFDIGSGSATGNTGLPVITGTLTGLGSLATGGTGGIGVAIPAIGTVARSTQKALGFGKAEKLLQLIEQGGQVTGKMVSELPQAEKNKFLKYVAGLPAAQATAIMNGTKDKVQ